ncbi:MAG TPA: cytochrome c3 family protein [Bdellovibrionota bacterium]|nr:cytochrome c3 family protein [Bdellovibrionota bacterium]
MFISKLRQHFFWIAPIAVTIIGGCVRTGDWRQVTPKQTVHPSILFNHAVHAPVIQEKNLHCLSCHPQRDALKPLVITSEAGPVWKCHDCHRKPEMAAQATQRCFLCHKDVRPLIPADHRLDWTQRHAVFARLDEFSCATCHDRSSCVDCHMQRDSILQTVHPRTFLYVHSVEARANPHSCGSCHQIQFCRDCHTKKGISF